MDGRRLVTVEVVKDWDAGDFRPGTIGREGFCTWGDDRDRAVATVVMSDRNGRRSTWAACDSHRRSVTSRH